MVVPVFFYVLFLCEWNFFFGFRLPQDGFFRSIITQMRKRSHRLGCLAENSLSCICMEIERKFPKTHASAGMAKSRRVN